MSDSKDDVPRYRVDDVTRELLEAALNMVSQTATLQISEEGADGLVGLCDEIAHRFYIECDVIDVVDERAGDTPDDPSTLTVYRAKLKTTERPNLRVIDGDLTDEPPTDDDVQH